MRSRHYGCPTSEQKTIKLRAKRNLPAILADTIPLRSAGETAIFTNEHTKVQHFFDIRKYQRYFFRK